MSLVGLDLNSGRARGVSGSSARTLVGIALEGDELELPLSVALDGRAPKVGRSGFALTRAKPHLVCSDFLPCMGGERIWSGERYRLDAEQALALTFAAIAGPLRQPTGVVLALPGYLDPEQIARLTRIARAAQIPLIGSISSSLAAVLASPLVQGQTEPGFILVVDADSYALTWSVVERRQDRDGGQLSIRLMQHSPALGRGLWLRKLLDGVALRCVRQSRRDPRESAATEQSLFEQLAAALDTTTNLTQLRVQGEGWYHHLTLHAEEMAALGGPILRQTVAELDGILATLDSLGRLSGMVVTRQAAGLPGLLAALRARYLTLPPAPDDDNDYGDMILASAAATEAVGVLDADALARVAHELAIRIHKGDFPSGHLDVVALPPSEGAEVKQDDGGPARLTFRGKEHLLPASTFSLGRDPSCDLVFESALYPHVSAKHCEVVFDRRAYVLRDRSRHGTLLNDRPIQQQAPLHSGDWIRLGPTGPVVRFLGESASPRNAPQVASNR